MSAASEVRSHPLIDICLLPNDTILETYSVVKKIKAGEAPSSCGIYHEYTDARFYELGLTRDSRVIPGLTVVSVLSTSNLGVKLGSS